MPQNSIRSWIYGTVDLRSVVHLGTRPAPPHQVARMLENMAPPNAGATFVGGSAIMMGPIDDEDYEY